MFTYEPGLALDAVTLQPARNATGVLTDLATGQVLATYDLNESPRTVVTNTSGYYSGFKADASKALLSFGDVALPVLSVEAIDATQDAEAAMVAAEASRVASQSSADSSAASALAAQNAQAAAEAAAATAEAPTDVAVDAGIDRAVDAGKVLSPGSLPPNLVTTDDTQTLTNKTLDAPMVSKAVSNAAPGDVALTVTKELTPTAPFVSLAHTPLFGTGHTMKLGPGLTNVFEYQQGDSGMERPGVVQVHKWGHVTIRQGDNLGGVAGVTAPALTVQGGKDFTTDLPLASFQNSAGTEVASIDKGGNLTAPNITGAWKSYTPQCTSTGFSLGNGTLDGQYLRIGKTVHYRARLIFGSTTTIGSGTFLLTLPFPPLAGGGSARFAVGQLICEQGSGRRPRTAYSANAEQVAFLDEGGTLVTGTTPFTPTTGTGYYMAGTYEIA